MQIIHFDKLEKDKRKCDKTCYWTILLWSIILDNMGTQPEQKFKVNIGWDGKHQSERILILQATFNDDSKKLVERVAKYDAMEDFSRPGYN